MVVTSSPATQVQLLSHTEGSELPKEREMEMDERHSYLPWWSDRSASRPGPQRLRWTEGRGGCCWKQGWSRKVYGDRKMPKKVEKAMDTLPAVVM